MSAASLRSPIAEGTRPAEVGVCDVGACSPTSGGATTDCCASCGELCCSHWADKSLTKRVQQRLGNARKARLGTENWIDRTGISATGLAPEGLVRIDGLDFDARCRGDSIPPRSAIRVVDVAADGVLRCIAEEVS